MVDEPQMSGHIGFYEREFYPLSNFSAFRLIWKGHCFDTSEAAYHWEKFPTRPDLQHDIMQAMSAHEAFKFAETHKADRRPDWGAVKVPIMLTILRAKAEQHEYVRRKLLETGDRDLVEDSWRDDFWGWGPNKDGQNMLGKLWMIIRRDITPPVAASRTVDPRAQIWPAAERIWQSEERAHTFLERPNMMLDGQRPYIVALQSPEGAMMVLQLLGRLEAGTAP